MEGGDIHDYVIEGFNLKLTCCQQHRGTIINRPDLFPVPTFVGGSGSSHIDVTVVFGRVPTHEWKLSEEFSGSDHKIIRVTSQDTNHEYPKRRQLRLTNFEKVREAATPDNSSAAAISAGFSDAVAANTPVMEGPNGVTHSPTVSVADEDEAFTNGFD
ncbi:hypothetical protein FOZ63_024683 [Perkinsus olseni]|uniref:Uncharacterized protein n=1 Tax=Perkinsus olseni TaxID=32597 RepID=A0A7J6S0P7_PEROL|nr:hypothetical protein FOZ63_024683 [Perkinsus olseni]